MPKCSKSSKCLSSALPWLLLIVGDVVIDQIAKWFVIKHIPFGGSESVFEGLNIAHVHNYGIAFGFFNQHHTLSRFILLGVALLISLVITAWMVKTPKDRFMERLGLSMILGGALGNIIDRIQHGYVIDFIDVYFQTWHFWTFNIADSLITVGAILLILMLAVDVLKDKKDERNIKQASR